jgi:aspartyl-tRNA(Asn)/glutamyl-tRNA(Gln) amidotransferase subunit B
MNGPIKQYCNDEGIGLDALRIQPQQIASIITLIDNNTISFSTASSKLWNALIKEPNENPTHLVEALNLTQQTNASEIEIWITVVLEKHPQKVMEYKKGKKGLIGFFVGEVVKLSKGKAAPKTTQELITKALA